MQQYMTGLLPMSQPQGGGGIGGMAQTALSMFMDKQKQAAQDTKMQAYISALRPDPGIMSGLQMAPSMAPVGATGAMPPMMGFD